MVQLCFILPIDKTKIPSNPKSPTKIPPSLSSLFLCFPLRRPRRNPPVFHDTAGVPFDLPPSTQNGSPTIFSYAELYIATNAFNDSELLGSGGFGRVYRALLPSDNSLVAVKCVAGPDLHLQKSFAAELVAVAHLRHRNLVRLRGWCLHDSHLLLVYDYMPNRSLDRLLFSPSAPPLRLSCRRNIVAGLAAALFYLHNQLEAQIIHRDVKASNVMLDSSYNARLGDFGLARWIEHSEPDDSSKIPALGNFEFRITDTTRIGGTIGYLPPESFLRRHAATAKSDVFSFGVVALEVATGRRAVDLAFSEDKIFMLDWVRQLADQGELVNACDKRIVEGNKGIEGEIVRLMHLGLLCSLHEPECRPTMKWVMEMLLFDNSGELPALPSFRSQPCYLAISSSLSATVATTMTTTTKGVSCDYVTALGSTVFLTANEENEKAISFPDVHTPRTITYKEIIEITDNFSESRMVAELDFGTGYHGLLENRFHVLVKRLGMKTCPALRSRFSDELSNLGRLRHRHLVQLRGWCTDRGEMLVVYDYPSGGVLSRRLFDPSAGAALSWRHRYSIIKSLASALLYLHEEWEEQVVHRSITSSSVFLDPDLRPRLGCFALAEFLSRNESGSCNVASVARSGSARGIFGYMAPEYMERGEATTSADVYSFGVVVLEIVSGRPAVDLRRPDGLLVRRRNVGESTADGRMEGEFDGEEVGRMVRLGVACTASRPTRRPTMKEIVSYLDGRDDVLGMKGRVREGKEEWEARNALALGLIRRMKALGIN